MTNYAATALQYCHDVIQGKIPACSFVKQACQRHINDLARQTDPEFPYYFDPTKVERICTFAELMPHIKGPKANTDLVLEPWQCFFFTVWGWLQKTTGKRRFRRVYVEIPKGNSKSFMGSVVALYMLMADGESGAEIYSAATTRDQAQIVFRVAQAQARKRPKMLEKFGAQVLSHSIVVPATNSKFSTFSSDANAVEGCNPHLVVFDELHAQTTRELYDNLETAMGKRDQNMMLSITTAGTDTTGICYEVRSIVVDILAGKKYDDAVWGIVYTLDKKDDWADDRNWIKANPNWGVSVQAADIGQAGNLAKQMVSKQASFKTKRLDVWVTSAHSWMDMQKWALCKDDSLSISDFEGRDKSDTQPAVPSSDCMVGMDLASRIDLIACMKLFWREIDGKRHYYAFGDYWLPEATIEKSENSQYLGWAESGLIHSTPGEVNDFDLVEAHLKETATRFNCVEIAHDPYLADMLVAHMQNEGLPSMVSVAQNVKNFSPALKELEACVLSGRFHHNGDPVLEWAVGNVEVKPDFNDNIYPRKAKGQNKNKIDPVVGLLMAFNRAMAQTADSFSWIG